MTDPVALPLPPPVADGASAPSATRAAPADQMPDQRHAPGGADGRGGPEEDAAGRLRALLTDPNHRVVTHYDQTTGRPVVRIEDRATGALIEQYPSAELLRLYAALRATTGCGLVDQCA
jgi:hypothetical protein